MADPIRCYGRTGTGTWTQEWYETSSRDAARRMRQLRKLGFSATAETMRMQVTMAHGRTDVGRVAMTLVHIRHADGRIPPHPEIER